MNLSILTPRYDVLHRAIKGGLSHLSSGYTQQLIHCIRITLSKEIEIEFLLKKIMRKFEFSKLQALCDLTMEESYKKQLNNNQ